MNTKRVLLASTFVGVAVMASTGCSSSAKQLCETRGGTYFEGGDYCEVPAVRSR
jgi:hypothetical protein